MRCIVRYACCCTILCVYNVCTVYILYTICMLYTEHHRRHGDRAARGHGQGI